MFQAKGKRALMTVFPAFAALDAFRVPDLLYIHPAMPDAEPAVVAFFRIDPHTEQGHFMKKSVKCAQRTEKPAEGPENENRGDKQDNEKQRFPLKKPARKLPQAFVF